MSETTSEDREYLLINGWYGVLNGIHRTGLWQRHDLFSTWTETDAVALQKWRDSSVEVHSLQSEIDCLRTENADLKAALAMASKPTIRLADGQEVHIGFVGGAQKGEQQ